MLSVTYLKILETFVLSVLMDKTEYNFFHKNFRPVKLLVILFLVSNLGFTVYLLTKLNRVYVVVAEHCPTVFESKTRSAVSPITANEKKK